MSGDASFGNSQNLKAAYTQTTAISKSLMLISVLKPVFKKDGNLAFNIGKTKVLTTEEHVFDRAQPFFERVSQIKLYKAHHLLRIELKRSA